ncbi:MAG: glycine--tRNA ligase subunit beta, partial [Candidatus Omnitrophica bacterium]|nr:glycine--tRNA ligase subunit beta [Candidatus Omnitrophota bacterium]
MTSQSLLFEIGVEEIPAGYFDQAKTSILTQAPLLLEECGFQFDGLKVFTTPRRFVVSADHFRPLSIQET